MLSSVQLYSQTIPPDIAVLPQSYRQKSDTSTESGDTFDKSAFSSMFGQLGLTPSSRLEATQERVEFNLSFTSSAKESLTTSGFVSLREQHASMTLKYFFQKEVLVDGRREMKSFQATLLLEADTSQKISMQPFKDKEDIIHFLNRIMNDVMKYMQDDSTVLTGISINQDDMAELMNLDNGKVRRLFEGLMSSIMTMAMLKRMKRGNDAGPNVILKEQRQISEGITAEKESSGNLSFSIDISEVATEQNAPSSAAQKTPATVVQATADTAPPSVNIAAAA